MRCQYLIKTNLHLLHDGRHLFIGQLIVLLQHLAPSHINALLLVEALVHLLSKKRMDSDVSGLHDADWQPRQQRTEAAQLLKTKSHDAVVNDHWLNHESKGRSARRPTCLKRP